MVNQVKYGAGKGQAGLKGQSHHHVADLADNMKRKNAAKFVLRGGSQYTGDHGQRCHDQQQEYKNSPYQR